MVEGYVKMPGVVWLVMGCDRKPCFDVVVYFCWVSGCADWKTGLLLASLVIMRGSMVPVLSGDENGSCLGPGVC